MYVCTVYTVHVYCVYTCIVNRACRIGPWGVYVLPVCVYMCLYNTFMYKMCTYNTCMYNMCTYNTCLYNTCLYNTYRACRIGPRGVVVLPVKPNQALALLHLIHFNHGQSLAFSVSYGWRWSPSWWSWSEIWIVKGRSVGKGQTREKSGVNLLFTLQKLEHQPWV